MSPKNFILIFYLRFFKMNKNIILVTGGARSGKSTFAQKYASSVGSKIAYLATARILDEEMKDRVERHIKSRPSEWVTFECPENTELVLDKINYDFDTIIFDCVTLYLTNLLLSPSNPKDKFERQEVIFKKIDLLLETALNLQSTIIFVANEVGLGIVPDNSLAREFRDLAGIINQKIAKIAAEVYLVTSGIPIDIKKLAQK